MVAFKLIYSVIFLMVAALARPSPPSGSYYKNLNPQGTACVETRWSTSPHEDVKLVMKCGDHSVDSNDLTVDELRPFVYKVDEHSKPDYDDFRLNVNIRCLGFVRMYELELFKFEYSPDSQTIKTVLEEQQHELRAGSCF
ncbi:hypothetical protein FOZ63_026442 [Perkinsus olseni]|uniref:Uncharacterized protein n=1 Tax=Perkinsus olseni TaxID=32597 RepID=A0A7J6RFD4_PEROL|nr:hypothetical protein FOZ62_025592 [Perkinsus olseni]KAF4719488.1 hypothetical protein FOZ63_026442 [Perkinsus olseni]